jgi:hypothetical protein
MDKTTFGAAQISTGVRRSTLYLAYQTVRGLPAKRRGLFLNCRMGLVLRSPDQTVKACS